MSKSKVDKRQFHKKQRMNNTTLRHLYFSKDDSEDWEDEILDIYSETSNNYTTMRSNGESIGREQDN